MLEMFDDIVYFFPARFFAPPPVRLFTVAHAMRSAAFSGRPLLFSLASIFAAIRFCLLL